MKRIRRRGKKHFFLYLLERFGATHDLVVLGQLLQQQTVVSRAGGQEIVGQIGQIDRALLSLPLAQVLLLLQHLLVNSHVLLLGAGQLAASRLRIGQRGRRRLARLATSQRTYTHGAPLPMCRDIGEYQRRVSQRLSPLICSFGPSERIVLQADDPRTGHLDHA